MAQFINAREDLVTEAIDGLLRGSGGHAAQPLARLQHGQGAEQPAGVDLVGGVLNRHGPPASPDRGR